MITASVGVVAAVVFGILVVVVVVAEDTTTGIVARRSSHNIPNLVVRKNRENKILKRNRGTIMGEIKEIRNNICGKWGY